MAIEFEASPSDAGFRADPEERLARPLGPPPLARAVRWVALSGAVAVHAVVVALLILEYRSAPAVPPQLEEIPVEIVVEQPPPQPVQPPQPPAPSPEPSLKTQALDEAPARDAPRAANDEKIERPAPDEKTAAPQRADSAKSPGVPTAPETPAAPTRDSEAAAEPTQPQPTPDKAADAADGAIAANSQDAQAEAPRAATPVRASRVATFVGQPLPNWSKGGTFSSFDPLPDVEFGSAAETTPIAAGKAKKTYLTTLYGMIMAHVRYSAANGHAEGEIVFVVDGEGKLVQRQVARPSGSRELDAIALGAVAEAAPFPAPPQGQPVRLRFTYGSK